MNIDEIKKEVLQNWTDCYGRVTLSPAALSDPMQDKFDSDNQLLFTGMYSLMLEKLEALDLATFNRLHTGMQRCRIEPGLYNRHPRFNEETISFDEYNGLCYLSSTEIEGGDIALDIVKYGKRHHYGYINEFPGASGLRLFGRGCPPCEGKDVSRFFPYLGRVRQPRDVAFYKMVAEISPSAFEVLYFLIAALIGSITTPDNSGGVNMWYFRFLALENKKLGFFSKHLVNLGRKFLFYQIKKTFGEKPLIQMFKAYFNKGDCVKHPFHELAKLIEE